MASSGRIASVMAQIANAYLIDVRCVKKRCLFCLKDCVT
jgi:hypothetical protein